MTAATEATMIFENADTLYDSAKGEKITPAQVKVLLRKHGHTNVEASFTELIAALGVRSRYDAQTVLEWLGY